MGYELFSYHHQKLTPRRWKYSNNSLLKGLRRYHSQLQAASSWRKCILTSEFITVWWCNLSSQDVMAGKRRKSARNGTWSVLKKVCSLLTFPSVQDYEVRPTSRFKPIWAQETRQLPLSIPANHPIKEWGHSHCVDFSRASWDKVAHNTKKCIVSQWTRWTHELHRLQPFIPVDNLLWWLCYPQEN